MTDLYNSRRHHTNAGPTFESIWRNLPDFELPGPTMGPLQCRYAQEFSGWTEDLLEFVEEPSVVSVNQAKVLLLDKYFEWRRFVPQSHRRRLGNTGHCCIYQVFASTYDRLKLVELSLTPPMLFLPPPPPPPPPPPQIAGIFLGQLDEQ